MCYHLSPALRALKMRPPYACFVLATTAARIDLFARLRQTRVECIFTREDRTLL